MFYFIEILSTFATAISLIKALDIVSTHTHTNHTKRGTPLEWISVHRFQRKPRPKGSGISGAGTGQTREYVAYDSEGSPRFQMGL